MSLLVITGKSCSGKDTLQRELMKEYGVKKIITYTTRPMREGETDGVQYHFISAAEFAKKREEGFFLESVDYHTLANDTPAVWSYGSSVESYREAAKSDEVYSVILTRPGLHALKDAAVPHVSVFLDVSDDELLARQIIRGDDESEAARRFEADKRDFDGIKAEVDYTFNADRHVNRLAAAIYEIMYPEYDLDR